MRRPPARGSPYPGEAAGPQDPWGSALWVFQGTVQRKLRLCGLEASGWGWQMGAQTAEELWWGHARGMGRAGAPPNLGAQGGLSHGPVRRKKREAGPGSQGKRDAAGRRSGPGDQGSIAVSPTPWGQPAARDPSGALASLPGRRGYGERRVHTRAHTPREHAQCGPGNFLPSRERPWPLPRPLLAKLGAAGARVWVGARGAAPGCRPLAFWFPASPLPGPGASLFHRPRGWEQRRG